MARLTKKQAQALQMVADADGKSGRYYHDLGASMVTLGRLEGAGLVVRVGAIAPMLSRWAITDAGRSVLEGGGANG